MISLIRTDTDNPDFHILVKSLDKELADRDGDEHAFLAELNKTDQIKNVVIAYSYLEPIGCGAFKPFDKDTVEIKRMYVKEDFRGQKVASHVLSELEEWALESGYSKTVLETGVRQPEALGFYHKMGYAKIPNYGQYKGIKNSVCFSKEIRESAVNFNF